MPDKAPFMSLDGRRVTLLSVEADTDAITRRLNALLEDSKAA